MQPQAGMATQRLIHTPLGRAIAQVLIVWIGPAAAVGGESVGGTAGRASPGAVRLGSHPRSSRHSACRRRDHRCL